MREQVNGHGTSWPPVDGLGDATRDSLAALRAVAKNPIRRSEPFCYLPGATNIFEAREDCNSTLVIRPDKPLARYLTTADGWHRALPRGPFDDESAMETVVLSGERWNAACAHSVTSLVALAVVSKVLPVLPLDLASALEGHILDDQIATAVRASRSGQPFAYQAAWNGKSLTIPFTLNGDPALVGVAEFSLGDDWSLDAPATTASMMVS